MVIDCRVLIIIKYNCRSFMKKETRVFLKSQQTLFNQKFKVKIFTRPFAATPNIPEKEEDKENKKQVKKKIK